MSKNVIELTSENFENEVMNSTKTVIVDFFSSWCLPCSLVSPEIDSLADKYKDVAKVGTVNYDKNRELALKYGVQSVPTTFVFENGEIIDKVIGTFPKERYINILDNCLNKSMCGGNVL